MSSATQHSTAPPGGSRDGPRPAHYDAFPYDVGVDASAYLLADDALGRFLRALDGGIAVDIGCGPGNLLPAIIAGTGHTMGLELSAVSARLAARCAPAGAAVVRADARHLPIRSGSVDHALATGSFHHTGDAEAAFHEMARILRPGGRAFVAVYGRRSYYERLYRSIGAIARRSSRRRLTDAFVNRGVFLAPFALYFVAGRLGSRRSVRHLSLRQIRNYYADQLLNPVVSFHTTAELSGWAHKSGLEVVSTGSTHAGALLQLVVGKPNDPSTTDGIPAPLARSGQVSSISSDEGRR